MPPTMKLGLFAALGAYTIWGLLPLYFKILGTYTPEAILLHRVSWSLPTGLLLIFIAHRWRDVRAALTGVRLPLLILSGLLIGLNWFVYIWAVGQSRVMEAALGYYINPLVNVAIGAAFLGERLRLAQWAAVGLATVGVIVETLALGRLPWVSLVLCFSFAFYSLIRKKVAVDSRAGFLIEVMALLPVLWIWAFAVGFTADLQAQRTADWPLLILLGPITTAPLILFAIAAKRLRLSTIGFIQYLGPTLQFLVALGFGEPLNWLRVLAFLFIWAAILVFSLDGFRHEVRMRRARRSIPAAVGQR